MDSTFQDLQTVLRSRPNTRHGKGASLEQIEDANRRLGLLPSDYINFLREFGWLEIGPHDVFGLGPDVPRHMDVVNVSLFERALGMPDDLVAIHPDGGGSHSCVVSGRTPNDQAEIVFWAHDARPDAVADGA